MKIILCGQKRFGRDVLQLCLQHFDLKRHRPYAPVIYFASDTGDDYFHGLMQEHEV